MPNKRTRTKKPSKAGFLILVLLCAGAVFAVAKYVKGAHADVTPTAERRAKSPELEITRSSSAPWHHEGQDQSPGGSVTVFAPTYKGENLAFSKSTATVPEGVDPKVFAVNEYLRVAKIAAPDARLLSVDVRGGIASLDFNDAMNQTFGSDDESTLLNGILQTMGQFPDVNSVLFFSQGKPIESFGNVDLTSPQAVIREGGKPPTTHREKQAPSE